MDQRTQILEIFHFDEETRALEETDPLLASARLYRLWKKDPTSLPKLLRAASELWLTMLDISESMDDTREPFTIELGIPEYEAMFIEEIKAGLSMFQNDSMFLAFFSHMASVHFGFFLWLWKESGENFDNWIDQAIDTGNIACQMDPSNLFAKAINRYGIESADVRPHKESCAAFWRAVPIDQWEHGNVGEYFFYVLAGDEMYRTGLKGY